MRCTECQQMCSVSVGDGGGGSYDIPYHPCCLLFKEIPFEMRLTEVGERWMGRRRAEHLADGIVILGWWESHDVFSFAKCVTTFLTTR